MSLRVPIETATLWRSLLGGADQPLKRKLGLASQFPTQQQPE